MLTSRLKPSWISTVLGVKVQERQEFPLSDLDGCEVPQPLERDVELQVLSLHIVAQRHHVPLEGVEYGTEGGVEFVDSLGDRFVTARLGGLAGGLSVSRGLGDGVDELEEEEILTEPAVPDQLDVAVDLLDGVRVVPGEVCRDTDQPWRRPIDPVALLAPSFF